jgi:DNA-binding GntR family transcriptional regulator
MEEPPEPEYPSARVLRVLRDRIAGGEWQLGERLPAISILARELDAGHGTIRQALQKLAAEGWLVILPRYGTFRSRRTPPKS